MLDGEAEGWAAERGGEGFGLRGGLLIAEGDTGSGLAEEADGGGADAARASGDEGGAAGEGKSYAGSGGGLGGHGFHFAPGEGAGVGLLLRPGSEEFATGGDEGLLFGCGQGEGGEDFLRQLGEGEGVGGAEFALPASRGEDVPAEGGDPVRAGEIRCGNEAVELEEFGEAGGAGGVGEQRVGLAASGGFRVRGLVEVEEGEHFAADGLVADPKDEVGAPLHGFGDVGEGKEKGAEALGVHWGQGTRFGV